MLVYFTDPVIYAWYSGIYNHVSNKDMLTDLSFSRWVFKGQSTGELHTSIYASYLILLLFQLIN